MTVVLDASALLAYLHDESGASIVAELLATAYVSSVNWAEVVQKSLAAGAVVDGMRDDVEALGVAVTSFLPEDGDVAGQLWAQVRHAGLSLGDRACLSLGIRLGIPVVTTDRVWQTLGLMVEVRVIR